MTLSDEMNDGPIRSCKIVDGMFSRFDTNHVYDRRTDGRTHGIGVEYTVHSIASRGKKSTVDEKFNVYIKTCS